MNRRARRCIRDVGTLPSCKVRPMFDASDDDVRADALANLLTFTELRAR